MGGARLLTRKYIVMNVQSWAQTKYSAILVGVTATGICFGPGISSLLLFYNGTTSIGQIPLEQYNLFAWVFIFVWIIMLVISSIFFVGKNPEDEIETQLQIQNKTKIIRFFKDVKQEQYKHMFDLNEKDIDEFQKSAITSGIIPPASNTYQNQVNDNLGTKIGLSKFVDFETKEALENNRINIESDDIENNPTSQGKNNVREAVNNNIQIEGEVKTNLPVNYYQSENFLVYQNRALQDTENLTASVKVIHPFRWTLFATFALFVTKVLLSDRRRDIHNWIPPTLP